MEGFYRFHSAQTSPLVQMWIKTETQNINNTNDAQKKYSLGMVSKNILLEGLNRFHSASSSPLVQMWIKTHRCLFVRPTSEELALIYR